MIFLGADHGGFHLKEWLKGTLSRWGVIYSDVGPNRLDAHDDYPAIAARVARRVSRGLGHRGILICRTGVGMAVAANKVAGIRAVQGITQAVAVRSRREEDSNVLALGADFLTRSQATAIVRAWLGESFRPQPRYRRRLRQLTRLDHGKT